VLCLQAQQSLLVV